MHFVNFIMPHLGQLVHAAWQWQLFKFPATVWTIQLNTFSCKTLQTNLPEIQCSLMPCKSTHVSLMKLVSGAFNWWPSPISTRDSIGKPKQVTEKKMNAAAEKTAKARKKSEVLASATVDNGYVSMFFTYLFFYEGAWGIVPPPQRIKWLISGG